MTENFTCPLCGHRLTSASGCLKCTNPERARPHSFDIASAGYVNLIPSHKSGGDDKSMVRARSEFLASGHYEMIANALAKALCDYSESGILLDAGCGEGYYTNRLSRHFGETVGIDLSKEAITSAAKAAKRQGISDKVSYAVAGIFELPFKDNSISAISSVFAPIAEDEFLRVLKQDGIFVCVAAGSEHLMGLKEFLYETTYENTERADLPEKLELIEKREISYDISLQGSSLIWDLFTMTPYYYKTSPEAEERLKKLDMLKTRVHCNIYIYRKK